MNTFPSSSAVLDADLVSTASRGDKNAFGALVSRHQSAVCGVAYSVCGEFASSEDIAQDAFIAAWKQLPELRQADRFRSWVCGIARQLALGYIRRKHRRGDRPLGDETAAAACADATPDRSAVSEEEKALLWRTLDRLPDVYREPLVLFYREQQSIKAVAEALDISEVSVKQRLSRGRAALREEVAHTLEGALGRTRPDAAFTRTVLGALPPLVGATAVALTASTAKAASTGGWVAKGGTVAMLSWSALGSLVSGFVGLLGVYAFVQYFRAAPLPPSQAKQLWRTAWQSLTGTVLLGGCLTWLAVGGGEALVARGLSPGLMVASLVLGVMTLNLALALKATRALLRLQGQAGGARATNAGAAYPGRRYQTSVRIMGLPLFSMASGPNPAAAETHGTARGWVALGDVAYGGLFACGGIAIGPIAIGGVGLGAVTLGGAGLGVLSLCAMSVGWWSCGGFAAGWELALGGLAVARDIAVGGVSVAHHAAIGGLAYAEHANDATANALLGNHEALQAALRWLPQASWLALLGIPGTIVALRQTRRLNRQRRTSI